MKKLLCILVLICICQVVQARHVAGGELHYEYVSTSGNISTYKITLRLFRDCQSNGPQLSSENVVVGFYENGALVKSLALGLSGPITVIQKNLAAIPCLVGNVNVCYEVAYFTGNVDLPDNNAGYVLTRTGCCRIDGITNISSNGTGSTFTTQIPGRALLPTGYNNCPLFNLKDTSLVCAKKSFFLDFGATDADGDSLSYSFCEAYNGTGNGGGGTAPSIITLVPLTYGGGFSGTTPLGNTVTINAQTGQISGIAPNQGQYVVGVCITEKRNGVILNTHQKDFILKVQDCDIANADLPEAKVNCKDYDVYFENQSTSSGIISYHWDFGDKKTLADTSNMATANYHYTDTGTFIAYLKIKGPNGCTGEDSMTVKIYPLFTANFNVVGSCYQSPFIFQDASTSTYGQPNKWVWKFGDTNNPGKDTSTKKNPTYSYLQPINATVFLIAESSKGCSDSIAKIVTVSDKPVIQMPFRDTLICSIDSLKLQASSPGITLTWQPNYNITSTSGNSPIVFPKDTTTYVVTASLAGCFNKDSVTVNVLDFITVDAMANAAICSKDTITLKVNSQALSYSWDNGSSLSATTVKQPLAFPATTTTYHVKGNLGKCQDADSVTITVFPYPQANAGKDVGICYGSKTQLFASIVGDNFNWTPTNSLLNPQSLSPVAGPSKTTTYILTVNNNSGCLKPVSDSITVKVVFAPKVFAGRDTSVVINQPLQLFASVPDTSKLSFIWQPATALDNALIQSPVAVFSNSNNIDSITYTVKVSTPEGCFTTDDIKVRVFKLAPDILVPDAFTPNNDGRNDVIKPIPIGVTSLDFFSVYNRWGQLLFTTKEIGKGWNGTVAGSLQSSATYVYQVQGVDFTGKTIYKKGVFVLIR